MVMLMNYTVIQNFDSSEFQANGHYRFKQLREATLYILLLGSYPNESGVRLELSKKQLCLQVFLVTSLLD
ncbi:hypothetical protein NIES4072_32340 [Nostoc commune NIES-4072]|uniref:Uncharacterized protein n=1 Tax=Nostoc commune NIES-4072 TaxID=2005467 RepID=A0A2R5FLB0_NOSCO|nr:hypothetical protein NIES4070_58420 [Nostoc commune HK-02]GBG19566.1 hypothetical protein NIES4072_32340 [Nostoc commune NIES-4072]